MTANLAGVVVPLVTPFDRDGGLDLDAHRQEVRYLVRDVHVHGLVVGGSTGEGHTLTADELRLLTATAIEESRGTTPIIAGIIENSTRAAVQRAKAVSDLGVSALQVTPPHYLFKPDEESLVRYFRTITEETGLPVIIYNVIPWCYLSSELVVKMLRNVDGIVGVKQSGEDLKLLADLLDMTEGLDSRIFTAVDALLYPSYTLGCHGAICALLTAVPDYGVEQWNATKSGDDARALTIHKLILRLWNAVRGDNLPANIKTVLRLRGRTPGYCRAPMSPSSRSVESDIKQALTYLGHQPLKAVGGGVEKPPARPPPSLSLERQ